MENDNNWSHRQEGNAPKDYTQHPTGARFTPQQKVIEDEYIASKPDKMEAVQNHPEKNYTDNNINALQATGQNNSFSDDNPVMGSENTFDSFNDTDPNRYNNNAGLGIPSEEGHITGFNDDAENEFIAKDYLNDDFESNEFDNNSESDPDNNYPKHPEF